MSTLQLPAKGHCFCQRVQYTLDKTPIFVNCCHCRDCQSLSGSAFAINIMVEAAAVKVTSDTQPSKKAVNRSDKPTDSSDDSFHCLHCGVMLWATSGKFGSGLVFLRAGTLEENEKVVPDAHFFTRSKHPWITLPDGVKKFETMPNHEEEQMFTGEQKQRFEAACAKSSTTH